MKEIAKVVLSIARLVAGLPPSDGARYYFQRLPEKVRKCILEKIGVEEGARVEKYVCPVCGRSFSRASGLVSHFIRMHGKYVELLVEECSERR